MRVTQELTTMELKGYSRLYRWYEGNVWDESDLSIILSSEYFDLEDALCCMM